MREIELVANACGLVGFRYFSCPPVTFAPAAMVNVSPPPTPAPAMPIKPAAQRASYTLLSDIAASIGDPLPALPRSAARRKAHPASRAALAAARRR